MMRTRYDGHHSICAILKQLYQDTYESDGQKRFTEEELRDKIATCVTMAKKMHERLKHYKSKEAQDEH
jgi:predicted metalloprotease with PDZ domain